MKLTIKILIIISLSGIVFTGCDEGNGLKSLFIQSDEPAGTNCTYGGIRIDSGLDHSQNGILESVEIDNTKYVCNSSDSTDGSDGANCTNGLTSLITMTDEPAGSNCIQGGVRIDTGLDDNNNGILDSCEIDNTEYVCGAITSEETQCLVEAGGYGVVVVNGRIWLDRNLGATETANSDLNNSESYGKLFQWGRYADGHEERNSTTTTIQANTIIPAHSDYIIGFDDWLESGEDDNGSLRSASWSSEYNNTTNPNQICPCGYVLPEINDFDNLANAGILGDLKLPRSGYRTTLLGIVIDTEITGHYWTREVSTATSLVKSFDTFLEVEVDRVPAYGLSARCIKP